MNLENILKDGQRNREDGFTLVELLVVILIIGILASIAVPVFLNQRKKAVDAALLTDIKTLSLAQESAITIKTPHGTFDGKVLGQTFTTLSKNSSVGTWITKVGYCVVGYNRNGTYIGDQNDQTTYVWFDSSKGGYILPPDKDTPPIGGACGNPRPPAQQQVWFRDPNP